MSAEKKAQNRAERAEKRRQEEQKDSRSVVIYSVIAVLVVVAAVVMMLFNSGILHVVHKPPADSRHTICLRAGPAFQDPVFSVVTVCQAETGTKQASGADLIRHLLQIWRISYSRVPKPSSAAVSMV